MLIVLQPATASYLATADNCASRRACLRGPQLQPVVLSDTEHLVAPGRAVWHSSLGVVGLATSIVAIKAGVYDVGGWLKLIFARASRARRTTVWVKY